MGEKEIERFLTHLAVQQNVSPTTQNLALQAILFLYRNVLNRELKNINAVRAQRPRRVPTVLSQAEVRRLLEKMSGPSWLVANLMYGSWITHPDNQGSSQHLRFGAGRN
jgi:site-specific recombinase XerD